jgi:uncharacterized protein VirK/YbjX
MARKSLEEIASKKRAEYRRRFELLDEIEASVKSHFCDRPRFVELQQKN